MIASAPILRLLVGVLVGWCAYKIWRFLVECAVALVVPVRLSSIDGRRLIVLGLRAGGANTTCFIFLPKASRLVAIEKRMDKWGRDCPVTLTVRACEAEHHEEFRPHAWRLRQGNCYLPWKYVLPHCGTTLTERECGASLTVATQVALDLCVELGDRVASERDGAYIWFSGRGFKIGKVFGGFSDLGETVLEEGQAGEENQAGEA